MADQMMSGDEFFGEGSSPERNPLHDSSRSPEHLRPSVNRGRRSSSAERAMAEWDNPPSRVIEILASRAKREHPASKEDAHDDDEDEDDPRITYRGGLGSEKRKRFGDRDIKMHKSGREAENKARRKPMNEDDDADNRDNIGRTAYWSGGLTDLTSGTNREPGFSGQKPTRRADVSTSEIPWAELINQDPGLLILCERKALDHMQAALQAHTGALIPQIVIIDEIVRHGYVRFVWDELLQGDEDRREVILRDIETWIDVQSAMHSEGRKSNASQTVDAAINQGQRLLTTIHISQIDSGVTENDIIEAFKKYGRVRGCVFPSGKWYGFVRMDHPDAAERAIRQLDGSQIKNRRIRCQWAKEDLSDKACVNDSAHFHDHRGHIQENKSDGAKTFDEHVAGIERWMPGLKQEYGGWRDLSAEALSFQTSGILHLVYMIATQSYITRKGFISRCQADMDFARGILKKLKDDTEQPFAMLYSRLVGLFKELNPELTIGELMFRSRAVSDNQDTSSALLGGVISARANAAKVHGRGRQPADSVSVRRVIDRLIEERDNVKVRKGLLHDRLGSQYQRLFRKRRQLEDELSFVDTSNKMYDLVNEASIAELEALIEQEKQTIAAYERSYDEHEYFSDEYDREQLLEASENLQRSVLEARRMGVDIDKDVAKLVQANYGRRRPLETAVETDMSKLAIDNTSASGPGQTSDFDSPSKKALPHGSSNHTRGGPGGRGRARDYGNRERNTDFHGDPAGGHQSAGRGGHAVRGGYRGSSGRHDPGRGPGRRDSRVDNRNWGFDESTGQSSNYLYPGPRRGNRGGRPKNY